MNLNLKLKRKPLDKDQQIAHLEQIGHLVRDCPGCQEIYRHPNPFEANVPRHKANLYCKSGQRNHCTCDTCW